MVQPISIMFAFSRLFLPVCLVVSFNASAIKIVTITSPNNQVKFSLSSDKDGLYYRVVYKGNLMIDKSRLNISFKEGGAFNRSLVIASAKMEKLTEDYKLITGKTSQVHSEC